MKEQFDHQELKVVGYATAHGFQFHEPTSIEFKSEPSQICMYILRQGSIKVHVSFIPHPIQLGPSEAMILAFPKNEWQVRVWVQEGTEFFKLCMQSSTLHKLLNPDFDANQLTSGETSKMRDLSKLIPVSPNVLMNFDQLLHHKLKPPFSGLFEKAKFLEIFSLLMESSFGQPMEACPVALSPVIESKLQQVRRHIIEHLDETPDPDQLAVMYELPRNTLREGYRYVYGKTIHQYHTDHKLESAMQMLHQGELLVKEVAFRIGYQNPSHFISAFKKKYGYTPKQYLKKK